MQYTDNEAALIDGLISNYLSRIQNALTFLSPLCRDTREAHKDMMGVTLKTDALLRANR